MGANVCVPMNTKAGCRHGRPSGWRRWWRDRSSCWAWLKPRIVSRLAPTALAAMALKSNWSVPPRPIIVSWPSPPARTLAAALPVSTLARPLPVAYLPAPVSVRFSTLAPSANDSAGLHQVGAAAGEFENPVAGADDVGVAAVAAIEVVGAAESVQRVGAAETVDLVIDEVVAEQRLADLGAGDDTVARVEDLLADGMVNGVVGMDRASIRPGDDEPAVGKCGHGGRPGRRIRRRIDNKLTAVPRAEGVEDLAADDRRRSHRWRRSRRRAKRGETWTHLRMLSLCADREYSLQGRRRRQGAPAPHQLEPSRPGDHEVTVDKRRDGRHPNTLPADGDINRCEGLHASGIEGAGTRDADRVISSSPGTPTGDRPVRDRWVPNSILPRSSDVDAATLGIAIGEEALNANVHVSRIIVLERNDEAATELARRWAQIDCQAYERRSGRRHRAPLPVASKRRIVDAAGVSPDSDEPSIASQGQAGLSLYLIARGIKLAITSPPILPPSPVVALEFHRIGDFHRPRPGIFVGPGNDIAAVRQSGDGRPLFRTIVVDVGVDEPLAAPFANGHSPALPWLFVPGAEVSVHCHLRLVPFRTGATWNRRWKY